MFTDKKREESIINLYQTICDDGEIAHELVKLKISDFKKIKNGEGKINFRDSSVMPLKIPKEISSEIIIYLYNDEKKEATYPVVEDFYLKNNYNPKDYYVK